MMGMTAPVVALAWTWRLKWNCSTKMRSAISQVLGASELEKTGTKLPTYYDPVTISPPVTLPANILS